MELLTLLPSVEEVHHCFFLWLPKFLCFTMALVSFSGIKSTLLSLSLRTSSVFFSRGHKKKGNAPKKDVIWGDTWPKMPIYYNFHKGERESDPDALTRFYRLHWGGWIRTKCGRSKKLWKKKAWERYWTRQHLIVDDRTAMNLEKMITPEYKKERHIVDDLYEPYHKRHNLDHIPRGRRSESKSYLQLMWEY